MNQSPAPSPAAAAPASLTRLGGLLGLLAAAMGLAVLAGWFTEADALKRVLPGAASMKANTALGFVALGLALHGLARGSRPAAVRALAAFAAVLAGLTLLQYLVGADFGIDRLLFEDSDPPYPGRMAPATAVAFLGAAAALLLLAAGRAAAGQAAALLPGTLGLLGLLGYLFGAETLYRFGPYVSVAVHTALLFAVLAGGTLCLRPEAGFMRELTAPGLGGQAARRMLLVGALLPPLAWLRLMGERAGLYGTGFGLALMVFIALTMLASIVWLLARSLNRAEAGMRLADQVLDNMNEGVTITDAEAVILRVNAGFTRITGYAAEEAIGKNPRLLQSGAQGKAFYQAMWEELLATGHWHGEVINRRRTGELYPELLSITAIRDDAGRTTHYVGVFADLSERLAREREVRQLADRLDLALHAGRIGTWLFNPTSGEFECDGELLALHGLDAAGAQLFLGQLLRRVHAEDRIRVRAAFEDCAFDGTALDIEYRVLPENGEVRYVAARGHVRNAGQGRAEAAGACWDITERRQSEEKIRALNDGLEQRVAERTVQLEAAVKELEAFSYSVAHDLRAPLRGLDGFSQILMEDYGNRLDDEAHSHLQRIRAASRRMGGLIDNLLDLSRLMRAKLRPEPVDLSRLAREVVATLRAEEPRRRVEVDIAPNLCTTADPTLAQVIVDNLLRNAWKYTAKRADAHIAFNRQPAQDGVTEYVVRDNGAGFDMRFADKLFKPFQRLHHERDFPGSGIGLASVARAVQRHGGRIRAEGRVGEGASIHFTLEAGGKS